jgi:hypothetical protein
MIIVLLTNACDQARWSKYRPFDLANPFFFSYICPLSPSVESSKLKKLARLFLEYKRLSGSLNRVGRATGGLWLKQPTDLLGEEKNAWGLEKPIGDCRPFGGYQATNCVALSQ